MVLIVFSNNYNYVCAFSNARKDANNTPISTKMQPKRIWIVLNVLSARSKQKQMKSQQIPSEDNFLRKRVNLFQEKTNKKKGVRGQGQLICSLPDMRENSWYKNSYLLIRYTMYI